MLLLVSGNQAVGHLSGAGDQLRYELLAANLYQGRGFTYAGQPTALRPPAYPLLLAAAQFVFGSHAFLAVRLLQFLFGLALAYCCFLLSQRFFGVAAGAWSAALALALPTLVYVSAELQTEALAALFTALFLLSATDPRRSPRQGVELGAYSGLAALCRFNAALLPPIGFVGCLWRGRQLKRGLIACVVAGVLIAPWVLRNAIVFHGRILYSSHGGINLLEGVLTPQGRGQPGEGEKLRAAVGWMHTDIERNDSYRLRFPSEDRLDEQARSAALAAWKNLGIGARFRLLAGKLACFWLSTDQLIDTTSFSRGQRYLRSAGVVVYWMVLALSVFGWRHLLRRNRQVAWFLCFFAAVVSVAHLPFVMNTRLRIPFLDPLLVVLAGGALASWFQRGLASSPEAGPVARTTSPALP